jgi:hypothetical protein
MRHSDTEYRVSYATSWEKYVDGNIVSKTSRRFIANLLAATGTSKVEESDDSSAGSTAQAWENLDLQVGNLDLVHQTLQGIAIRNQEEGEKALGRHARTIRLGRSLWQSEPLSPEVVSKMRESVFDEKSFPRRKSDRLLSLTKRNHTHLFQSYTMASVCTRGCKV